jgi:hypothetical protein
MPSFALGNKGRRHDAAHGSSETIFMNSASVHARPVRVCTLPAEPSANANLAILSPFGASTKRTRSLPAIEVVSGFAYLGREVCVKAAANDCSSRRNYLSLDRFTWPLSHVCIVCGPSRFARTYKAFQRVSHCVGALHFRHAGPCPW